MKKRWMYLVLMMLIILTFSCQDQANESSVEETPLVEEVVSDLEVSLTVLGRASVRLDFSDGRVVYIDPAYGSYNEYKAEADLVLVTHQHTDHNVTTKVTMKEDGQIVQCPYDIKSGGQVEVAGLKITAVDAYNSNHSQTSSCGFIIESGDLVIYHSGDTSMTDQMIELKDYSIDYAMLCMDGFYNMGPEEAEMVAGDIEAQVVIPIHTSADGSFNINQANKFDYDGSLVVKPGETIVLEDLSKPDIALDQAIETIMRDRLVAIENEDYDLYMSSVTKRNPYFYNEQERWFTQMIDDSISNLSLEIESTEIINEHTAVVHLKQTHFMDKKYVFTYPLIFKYENDMWKDYGYHFETLQTDRFEVKYMKDEGRLEEFVDMLDLAFDNLDKVYKEKPHPYFELKLFTDQEMLRQRCIPANEWLFTGWSEPDESLKLYTGHPTRYKGYPGVMQHEVVHHITIRMCNNNLPVWLLEGIAMFDGSAPHGIENSSLLSNLSRDSVTRTIADLEANDYYTATSNEEIRSFYNTSYMYVRYIEETYGREKLMDLFYEAGKKPFHDSTLNEAFESNNQKTADEVILTVLGLTKDQLSNGYLEWLEGLEF
ncbi:hypothetical protein EZV73_09315 [Acidaminobacter sp. JC074]|uniref:MBL fold metallo-hydrolase n=1 Tax=Acidaminobacter sp. JC074 TaxID=2530199 RepID=UPI001F0FB921|nr:MBL fold metallo-hydrolase [Acidaminobacter sp. JC074]MCH4887772.1 hypothetical protein [Acidaminobacter sp. JC074]